ncbi:YrhK family protein [Acidihalobacter ferrooxydans]|uniref:YrhK domain-containing protein n=1 Tax=Acidihalobacter ferrooxydans TaxID=1765967 RepID=A0A1P8UEQ2_9GAMM|nr:YrhK family protein [Acidihalobacter ferrooxydans]APZ42317.1 hypothetical protein BW247_03785 [Acidihalobacter ferrooxydans]
MPETRSGPDRTNDIRLTLGKDQLVISRRYETISILNDFLVALWFLIGSVMFLLPAWVTTGTLLFVLGSAQLLIRPCIRLAHHIHLRRIAPSGWGM